MIDIKVLQAAGLTDTQIVAVLEAASPLITELEQWRELGAAQREKWRILKRNQRSRPVDTKSCPVDSPVDTKISNGINGHVHGTFETLILSSSKSQSLKKESRDLKIAFEQFWNLYPKRVGKMVAEKAFAKALKQATASEILAALQKQKPNFPTDPKFIPHPATWLNGGRWLDEATAEPWGGQWR